MKKPSKTRVKAPAVVRFNTAEQVQGAIKEIGDINREKTRLTAAMNDEIAKITKHYAPALEALENDLTPLQEAVQAYCEERRDELTDNGKTKTANFITGEVQWRQRPPSVSVRGADSVIENLKKLGLTEFIRTKEEINKEAMLNKPDLANTVAGITIKAGVEDFIVTPFEQDVK